MKKLPLLMSLQREFMVNIRTTLIGEIRISFNSTLRNA